VAGWTCTWTCSSREFTGLYSLSVTVSTCEFIRRQSASISCGFACSERSLFISLCVFIFVRVCLSVCLYSSVSVCLSVCSESMDGSSAEYVTDDDNVLGFEFIQSSDAADADAAAAADVDAASFSCDNDDQSVTPTLFVTVTSWQGEGGAY